MDYNFLIIVLLIAIVAYQNYSLSKLTKELGVLSKADNIWEAKEYLVPVKEKEEEPNNELELGEIDTETFLQGVKNTK